MESLVLSDNAIAQIAKLLQVAILSGTDVVDHLRMLRLSLDDGRLVPDSKYLETFENQLESMMKELQEAKTVPST